LLALTFEANTNHFKQKKGRREMKLPRSLLDSVGFDGNYQGKIIVNPRCGLATKAALVLLFLLLGANMVGAQADSHLVYHMFVRSFADTPADTAPDGKEVGDLKGIREQLDYLNDGDPATDDDLEVGILWLMPVFPTRSYHGYDINDYEAINPSYGTMKDMEDLIHAAHQRGIRVILDIAFNHTSNEHPWFTEAVEDPSSEFRSFYHFRDINAPAPPGSWHVAESSSGQKVRYLGLFSQVMPDLNFDEPKVRQKVKEIAEFWINKGVDGFRLDAAKHIYGDTFGKLAEPDILSNNDFWREFSDHVYQLKSDAILVGEVLGDRETLRRHAYGNDFLLDEPFMHHGRSKIAFPASEPGFVTAWKQFVRDCRDVNEMAHTGPGRMPRSEPFHPFIFLASHDANPRLASHLENLVESQMNRTPEEAYRVGMYLLMSMGKYPILYNGDEVMQRGWKWNGNPPQGDPPGDGSGIFDETLREPFPWKKAGTAVPQTSWFAPRFDGDNDGVSVQEQSNPKKILGLVRALTNMRTRHPGFANGEIGSILTDSADWMVFEKVSNKGCYLVLINPTGHGADYRFHQGWFPRFINAQLIFWSDGKDRKWKDVTDDGGQIQQKVFVPPYGMVLLREVS
jgi:alpha-amylase